MSTLVTSALSALVVRHLVAPGDHVRAGTPLLVTETMKSESHVLAPEAGRVVGLVEPGMTVEPGEVLVRLVRREPTPDAQPTGPAAGPRSRRAPTPGAVLATICGPDADPGLGPEARTGRFVRYDLVPGADTPRPTSRTGDRLEPVKPHETEGPKGVDERDATYRARTCGVVVGVLTHELAGHPDGVSRVWIGGDPAQSMGAVSEAECRRIIAAIDLAEARGIPVEWIAVSAGARIAWDTGTETMDWCAAVVARLVQFTNRGGQVVVVVTGVNVGAQSYWNAEATMLPHHRGMLVMLEDQAMVLTGRRALELSGGGRHGSDAEIGGYSQVMGPNGEAHHAAADLVAAYRLVFAHHSLCTPRADGTAPVVATVDAADRNIGADPYPEPEPFETVGEVLEQITHPDRKQPFAVRPIMGALVDRDAPVLERWRDMADARGVVTWDSRVAGSPVTIVGIEARPVRSDTTGAVMSGSTLHPEGSRKAAKAIHAASGNRPVVVLANLAGFDGSATSMRGRQLEMGAEIARAVTMFDGPLVVVVLGRFHGGAYVVFSKALNESVSIVALEGTYVSVIGGDSAAGVVLTREVAQRVAQKQASAPGADPELLARRERSLIAREFDRVHDVARAASVGSVDQIIRPDQVRATVARLVGALPPTHKDDFASEPAPPAGSDGLPSQREERVGAR